MNFLRRDLICERLRLNVRQSYRLIGSSRSGLISSDEVVRILNRSRRGIAEPFDYIPSDIATPDENATAALPISRSRTRSRSSFASAFAPLC